MKRRVICVLLAALILVSLLPMAVSAASNMKTSEKAIALLKEYEGFSKMAYWDVNHYSIGYGSTCGKNEYPNGITEAEADALLRQYLANTEAKVNAFADKYGLTFTQNEFDALMLFSYNVGYGWTTSDSDFRQAVINGVTGNDFIFYMTRWCTDSVNVLPGLITRRLAEADLYLNGYYSTKAPDNFTYVLLDPNGGSCTIKIQGYDATDPVAVRATPVYTGYRFMGWYTAKEGGEWVTDLDDTTKGITLYAHWQEAEGPVDENGNVQGTAVSYKRKVTGSALDVYDMSNPEAEPTKLTDNSTVTIVADYVDEDGTKWGKLKDGGWIELTDTYVETTAAKAPVRTEPDTEDNTGSSDADDEEGVLVTVVHDYVNYRTGPNTGYTKLGCLYYGDQIRITEVSGTGTYKWGKFDKGWVCLMYTNYDSVIISNGATGTAIGSGSVTATSLRVRSLPGTGSDSKVLGTLSRGTYVQIYETKEAGGMTWGRIGDGKWVSLTYVSWAANSTTPSAPSTPSTPSTPSAPESNQPESSAGVTGTVTASALCIRSDAGTNSQILGYYANGTTVTITEQKKVGNGTWGKTDKGWICLTYVKLDNVSDDTTDNTGSTGSNENSGNTGSTENSGNNGNTGSAGSTGTTGSITGTVTASGLYIRSGAGTNHTAVGSYTKGSKVTITEQKLVNGVVWGKTDKGWICMSYVSVDAGSGTVSFSGTITASALCIRSAAGTTNAIVGRYVKGDSVVILETTKVGGVTWGRTDKGWICMDYVK